MSATTDPLPVLAEFLAVLGRKLDNGDGAKECCFWGVSIYLIGLRTVCCMQERLHTIGTAKAKTMLSLQSIIGL